MDVRNGRIFSPEEREALMRGMQGTGEAAAKAKEQLRHLREMLLPPRPGQKKVGRNDQCPCGSGRKFKKCCLKG